MPKRFFAHPPHPPHGAHGPGRSAQLHLPADPVALSRRRLLGWGGALGASAFGAPLLGSLLAPSASAGSDDYKALVCVFLYGGNDGMNMLPPRDATRHALYSAVRGPLALPRTSLVPLGTDHGLHPAMAPLATAWADGALAPLFNVGPLFAPLSKARFRAAGPADPLLPDSLFSHSDQQILWEAGSTDSLERTGWGGRAARLMGSTNPAISFGGNAHFTLSDVESPWVLPGPGSDFGANGFANWAPILARRAALEAIMREPQKSPMTDAYARTTRDAFELERRLGALIAERPDPATDASGIANAFASMISDGSLTNPLGSQLYQVARFVHARATVRGSRQIFFVQLGGFDNHAGQVGASALEGEHAGLLGTLASAMAAFWQALKAIGMADRVTLFTQSDFGRTFAPNQTQGTDHAWGNHHLVLGAAVAGRRTYGSYPTLALGGPDDVGVDHWALQGRWIPTTSVDQYAATLLRWWGMAEPQLDLALPNLRNFGAARNLGFMRA